MKLTEVVVGAECSISFEEIKNLVRTHHPTAKTVARDDEAEARR